VLSIDEASSLDIGESLTCRSTRNAIQLDKRRLAGQSITSAEFATLNLAAQVGSNPPVLILRRHVTAHDAPLAGKGLDQSLALHHGERTADSVPDDSKLFTQGGF
jgi:hypothetical protein